MWLADGSAHHAELTPDASRSGWLLENLADAPTLVESFAGAACNSACDEERQGPRQQRGSENHTPARLCRQPEPSLADRKELRVAEADPASASGELRGLEKVDWLFVFSCAAHNLLRLPQLMARPPGKCREQCC